MKNYILPIIAGLFILVAVPVTVYLAANPNTIADIRNRAATPQGTVEVRLDPPTATLAKVGDTVDVAVKVDPKGLALGSISISLIYNFTDDAAPKISVVGEPTNNVSGLNPIQNTVTVNQADKNVKINVAAYSSSSTGFISGSEFTFTTFKLKAEAPGSVSLRFEEFDTTFSPKGGAGSDVMKTQLTPYVYTVSGAAAATKYKCSGASCVADTAGTYTTNTCDNACTATTKKYKCSGTSCVEDAAGTYTTSNCNNACAATPRDYHLECRNNTCVKISGASNDTGGCSIEGRGCLHQHKVCVSNACVVQYCSPDTSPCSDNCVSNANCASSTTTITTTTTTRITPTPTPVLTQQTLPVTGMVENTALILFGGTLLLLVARSLLTL